MLVIYLSLLLFLTGWWVGDECIIAGLRRQAERGLIWETDRVLIVPIPKTIDRRRPWGWLVQQGPSQ